VAFTNLNKLFGAEATNFFTLAIELYQHQLANNAVYRSWAQLMPAFDGQRITSIPALPVSFFKTHKVVVGDFEPAIVFESSGTTGMVNSKHFVKDINIYETSFTKGFQYFYGDIQNWCVLALLPAYLEREGSSLVYMADHLIKASSHPQSGFYLYNHQELAAVLATLEAQQQPTILIGVTFALLDFAAAYPQQLKHTILMETGGMKGRGKELTRKELHETLRSGFGLDMIHGEYGMTELMSQAYAKADGRYYCPPWMKVLVRGEDDPFDVREHGEGLLQIIDLANMDSCSFIATQDMGKVYEDGSFEIYGRVDHADLRGCSLLVV
jgi:phenylacetate-coenzyme A ligase PaaK-like adenylate-forming protein